MPSSPHPEQPILPSLSSTPQSHPDLCLSISIPLLDLLLSILPASNPRILSIGSGFGLLEELLNQHFRRASEQSSSHEIQSNEIQDIVHGIEPSPGSANKYLPLESLHLVPGTWAILDTATALGYGLWLFVYPRERILLGRYLDMLFSGNGSKMLPSEHDQGVGGISNEDRMVIVWAGPRRDWEDGFGEEFARQGIRCLGMYAGAEGGVAEWEVVGVFECVVGSRGGRGSRGRRRSLTRERPGDNDHEAVAERVVIDEI